MKKYILSLILFTTCFALNAQTTVNLQINHKLGDLEFEFDTEAENDLGETFDVIRIEYYISSITLYHDEGLSTDVEDVWILANGNATTTVNLGDFDVTQVDSISFSIGVEEAVNHADPSLYAAGHPLGFQNPSMHWGWASGYRFVAMEGNAGTNLTDIYEVHALGDDNYFAQTIALTSIASNNNLVVVLDADYVKALSNVSVEGGLINHGFSGEALNVLENFRDLVFSPAAIQVGVEEQHTLEFAFYPNPVNANGQVFLKGNSTFDRVILQDLSGRTIQEWNGVKNQIQLDSHTSGTYILSVYSQDGGFATSKLIIR